MYVIITLPLLYVYGPFPSHGTAKYISETKAFKAKDVGEAVIRKVERKP